MSHKRQCRREAGIINALGRASTEERREPPSAVILQQLTRCRHRFARWIAPDLAWNPEMSIELDRWIDGYESACIEVEALQNRISELMQGGADE